MTWQAIDSVALPTDVFSWVADTGSLTQRCQQLAGDNYQLKLLSENWGQANPLEQSLLGLSADDTVKIREIYLCNGDTPLVFGHSILPAYLFDDKELNLASLKTNSLGHKLFTHPDCRRDPIFVKKLERNHPLYQAATAHHHIADDYLWGRYSVFTINHLKLMVYEIFFEYPLTHHN